LEDSIRDWKRYRGIKQSSERAAGGTDSSGAIEVKTAACPACFGESSCEAQAA